MNGLSTVLELYAVNSLELRNVARTKMLYLNVTKNLLHKMETDKTLHQINYILIFWEHNQDSLILRHAFKHKIKILYINLFYKHIMRINAKKIN